MFSFRRASGVQIIHKYLCKTHYVVKVWSRKIFAVKLQSEYFLPAPTSEECVWDSSKKRSNIQWRNCFVIGIDSNQLIQSHCKAVSFMMVCLPSSLYHHSETVSDCRSCSLLASRSRRPTNHSIPNLLNRFKHQFSTHSRPDCYYLSLCIINKILMFKVIVFDWYWDNVNLCFPAGTRLHVTCIFGMSFSRYKLYANYFYVKLIGSKLQLYCYRHTALFNILIMF